MELFGRSGLATLQIGLLLGAGCGSTVSPASPPSEKTGASSSSSSETVSPRITGEPNQLPTLRVPVGGRSPSIAFSGDGERIAISTRHIPPQIHRVESGDVELLVRHSDGLATDFRWCGGTKVVVGARYRDAEILDVVKPDHVVALEGVAGPVVCSASGVLLDPEERGGQLWDAASGMRQAKLGRPAEGQTVIWLSDDGSRFASVGETREHTTLTLADAATGNAVATIQEPADSRFVVSRSSIIATHDNNLTVFRLDGERLGTIQPVEGTVRRRTFAWSARDGGVWLAGPDSVALWDVEKGEPKHTIAVAEAEGLALAPDGNRLAIAFERWVELVDLSAMEGRPVALELRQRESTDVQRRRFWRDVCLAPSIDPSEGEEICREISFGSRWARGYVETAGDLVPPAVRHAYGYYDRQALESVIAAAGIDECAWLEHLRRNGTVPKPLPPEQEAGLARVLDAIDGAPADERALVIQLGCAELRGCADFCAPALCDVDITSDEVDAVLAICPDLSAAISDKEVDAEKLHALVERRFTAYLDTAAASLGPPARAALAKRRAKLGL